MEVNGKEPAMRIMIFSDQRNRVRKINCPVETNTAMTIVNRHQFSFVILMVYLFVEEEKDSRYLRLHPFSKPFKERRALFTFMVNPPSLRFFLRVVRPHHRGH